MLNLGTVEGIFLDDGLFTFYVDGKKYVRKVRKNLADQKYIKFNHREFLVQQIRRSCNMNRKTIRLNDGCYSLKNGILYTYCRNDNDEYEENETNYKIGATAILVSSVDLNNDIIKYYLRFCQDGLGGNSNPDIKRYHGWRGTTNDESVYANGLRRIIAIRELKNGKIAVTVGKDLLPNED